MDFHIRDWLSCGERSLGNSLLDKSMAMSCNYSGTTFIINSCAIGSSFGYFDGSSPISILDKKIVHLLLFTNFSII